MTTPRCPFSTLPTLRAETGRSNVERGSQRRNACRHYSNVPTMSTHARIAGHIMSDRGRAAVLEPSTRRPGSSPSVSGIGIGSGMQSTSGPSGSIGTLADHVRIHMSVRYECEMKILC